MTDAKKVKGNKIKNVKKNMKDVSDINEIDEVMVKKKVKKDSDISENVLSSVKRVKSRRIHSALSDEQEQKLDREIEHEDDLSIMVMICILVLCFFVGISLGYMLYRIAINSSNAMMIVKYFFNM